MAVGEYRVNGERIITRSFEVPKRPAQLKYWWKAARNAMAALPPWDSVERNFSFKDLSIETIILEWENRESGALHRLTIARKKRLL